VKEEAVIDVFISYKREERAHVERIEAALNQMEINVWFDWRLTPGEVFSEEIIVAANGARAMIVCWSPAACESKWVNTEARIGWRRKVLVPVSISPCQPPAEFSREHATDLSSWNGGLDDRNWQVVLERLEGLLNKPKLARNARLRAGGQHDEMVAILRSLLVAKARSQEPPFTYDEAEAALRAAAIREGLAFGDFDQPTLWGALDAIAEQNRRRGEPPLPVLVVNESDNRPGRGYFRKHAFLTRHNAELEELIYLEHTFCVRAFPWLQDAE
jgi:hypothetical protein